MPQTLIFVPTTRHVVGGITKSYAHEPLRNIRRGGAANHIPRRPDAPSATAAEPAAQGHGFSVLLPEYRGYGRSGGTPTQAAVVSDFVAFYDRLRGNPAVDASHIYFHGRSLGGAVACAVALERRPRALILESTFTSVRQLARERDVPSFLVADSFDSEAAIAGSTLPVLLIHGRQDTIVPVQHAVTLASALPNHTLLLLSCGHNDCPLPASEILQFLDTAGR